MDARTPGKSRERRGEAGIDGPLISSRRGSFWVGAERVGRIDPEKLIREARKRVASGDVSRRPGRQTDAK
jgi:hypothetical protein